MELPQDFVDLLLAFAEAEVHYLIVGGYAVAVHDRPRTTKDLDVLLDPDGDNLRRACLALDRFGAPGPIRDALSTASPDEIVWWGQPPLRIDLLQSAPGVDFRAAYARRMQVAFGEVNADVLSLDDLILAKRAAGRPQDLVDVQRLEQRKRELLRE